MKSLFNIDSQLDALRLKDIEIDACETFLKDYFILPKVSVIPGVNMDFVAIKDTKFLFLKFMETNDDIFGIIGDEIVEVIDEEIKGIQENLKSRFSDFKYSFAYIMPFVDIENEYPEHADKLNYIIDSNGFNKLKSNEISLDHLFKEENDSEKVAEYIFDMCPEYFLLNVSKNFTPTSDVLKVFEKNRYRAAMKTAEQIEDIVSIKYGDTLIKGGSGTGKTNLLVGMAIKMARVYPHHRFMIITNTKHVRNYIRDYVRELDPELDNLDIESISSFVFTLAKQYELVVDYEIMKKDYDKTFINIIKQADNVIKNKNTFKGIFMDEMESFSMTEIEFIKKFLYKSKNVFVSSYCRSLNMTTKFDAYSDPLDDYDYDYEIELNKNYRQSEDIVDFVNTFIDKTENFVSSLRDGAEVSLFDRTCPLVPKSNGVSLIKVKDLDDHLNSVVWEIENLINNRGIKPHQIAVIYPYNKKRLKSGNTIYFQYMLRAALEEADINYIFAEDEITDFSHRKGVTLSNIYSIKSMQFKAVIICELEMLYNQTVSETDLDYQINDYVGDLNKLYFALTRGKEYISIITTLKDDSSDIIRFITESVNETE